MDRYIGLDAHSETCTFAVMTATGKRLKEQVFETNSKVLVDWLRSIAGHRHLCMEEGSLSDWLYEVIEPHVHELVVVQPEKRQGSKSDSIDAWQLAERARTRRFGTRVFKSPRRFTALRQAVRAHRVAVQEMVRTKNRLKALYRSRGVQGMGDALYDPERRKAWLKKLRGSYGTLAEQLALQLDAAMASHSRAEGWLLDEAKQLSEVKRLMTVDGLGPIRAAQVVAAVVTPNRFRKKNQFWSYCGLGIVTHSSSDWKRNSAGELSRRETVQVRGLNRNRNPALKAVFKGAAKTVLANYDHPLTRDYARMVASGTKPNLAELTIARRIASAVLSIWKHKEVYVAKKHRSKDAA